MLMMPTLQEVHVPSGSFYRFGGNSLYGKGVIPRQSCRAAVLSILAALFFATLWSRGMAQDYSVATFAGFPGHPGNAGGVSATALFDSPQGIAVAPDGTVYVADTANSTIRKIALDGTVSILAGAAGSTGTQNGTGTDARFSNPQGLLIDSTGNLLVADLFNHAIRKVTLDGVVTTFAGKPGSAGSTDGPAAVARFNDPSALAMDTAGNIYVADSGNNTVRAITPGGVVTTLAGKAGLFGSTDGVATAARFNLPSGIAFSAGLVWVADSQNHTIRSITSHGAVKTIAGQAGKPGAQDGKGTNASFQHPHGLAVDSQGFLYVADENNHTLRSVAPDGTVATVAGSAGIKGTNDGPALSARFSGPTGLAIDPADSIFVADTGNDTIRKAALSHPRPTRILSLSGDLGFGIVNVGAKPTRTFYVRNVGNSPLTVTNITYPAGFSGSGAGIVQPQASNAVVVIFNPPAIGDYGGQITIQSDDTAGIATLSASGSGAILPIPAIALSGNMSFGGVVVGQSSERTLTISNTGNGPLTVSNIVCPAGFACIWSGIIPAGGSRDVVITFAPDDEIAYAGLVAVTSNAESRAGWVALSGAGTSHPRREILLSGNLEFGRISMGSFGRSILHISNEGNLPLNISNVVCPNGILVPWAGIIPAGGRQTMDVYFTPGSTNKIDSEILFNSDALNGSPKIHVSGYGAYPYNGTSWDLLTPAFFGLTFDATNWAMRSYPFKAPGIIAISRGGRMYVLDSGDSTIKDSSPQGLVKVVAGTSGVRGYRDGMGTNAMFNDFVAAAFGPSDYLYVIDSANGVIRKVSPDGEVSTVRARNGSILRVAAEAIAVADSGVIFIRDTFGNLVQIIENESSIILTPDHGHVSALAFRSDGGLFGASPTESGVLHFLPNRTIDFYLGGFPDYKDGSPAQAAFNDPQGIAFDAANNMYIADTGNKAIRMVSGVNTNTSTILGGYLSGLDSVFEAPSSVAVDRDQNLWFADTGLKKIYRAIHSTSPMRALSVSMSYNGYALGLVGIGESVARTLILANSGNAAVHVDRIDLPNGFSGAWSGTIDPGQFVTVPVIFQSAVEGHRGNLFYIESDANVGDPYFPFGVTTIANPERTLFATGDLDFGDVPIGASVTRTIGLTNSGNASIFMSGISLPLGFYGATQARIGPGTTLQFNIEFRPSELRNYSGGMIINSDATAGFSVLPVAGRGVLDIRPELKLKQNGGGPIMVNWPDSAGAYFLESSITLDSTASWTSLTNGVVLTNNQYGISINPTQKQSFFRLRKP